MIPLNLASALAGRKKFVEANDDNTAAGASGTGTGSLLQLRAANETGMVFIDKSPTGFTGLINQGATCYLNSLLQTLYCIPEFKWALYQSDFPCSSGDASSNLCRQLQKLFTELDFTVRGAVTTNALTKSFGWSARDSFQQQDVQECMTVIFEFIKVSYPCSTIAAWLNSAWQGEIKSFLVCHNCHVERAKRSEIYRDLQLQVRGMKTLSESLEAYFSNEELEGVECEACGGRHTHSQQKSLDVEKLPEVLTIQLRRFDMDWNTFQRVKVHDVMDIPQTLTLSPTLLTTPSSSFFFSSNTYELTSVMMHSGSAYSGHYFAYIKTHGSATPIPAPNRAFKDAVNNTASNAEREFERESEGATEFESGQLRKEEGWMLFNDSNVTALTDEEVATVFSIASPDATTSSSIDLSDNKFKDINSTTNSGGKDKSGRRKQLIPINRHAYMLVYRRVKATSEDQASESTLPSMSSSIISQHTSKIHLEPQSVIPSDRLIEPLSAAELSLSLPILALWQEVQNDNDCYLAAQKRYKKEQEYLHITVHRERIGAGNGANVEAGSSPSSSVEAGAGTGNTRVKVFRIHQDQTLRDLTDLVYEAFYPSTKLPPPNISVATVSRTQVRLRAYDLIKNENIPVKAWFPALVNATDAPDISAATSDTDTDTDIDTTDTTTDTRQQLQRVLSQLDAEGGTFLKDIDDSCFQKYIYLEVNQSIIPTCDRHDMNEGIAFSPLVDGDFGAIPEAISSAATTISDTADTTTTASQCNVMLYRYIRSDCYLEGGAETTSSVEVGDTKVNLFTPGQSLTLSTDMSWQSCREAIYAQIALISTPKIIAKQERSEGYVEDLPPLEHMVIVALTSSESSISGQQVVIVTDCPTNLCTHTNTNVPSLSISTISIHTLLTEAIAARTKLSTTSAINTDEVRLFIDFKPRFVRCAAGFSNKSGLCSIKESTSNTSMIETLDSQLHRVDASITLIDVVDSPDIPDLGKLNVNTNSIIDSISTAEMKEEKQQQQPRDVQQCIRHLRIDLDSRMTLADAKLKIAEDTQWSVGSFRFVQNARNSRCDSGESLQGQRKEMRDMSVLLSSLIRADGGVDLDLDRSRSVALAVAESSWQSLSLSLTVEKIPPLAPGEIRVALFLKELLPSTAVKRGIGKGVTLGSDSSVYSLLESQKNMNLSERDDVNDGREHQAWFVFHQDDVVRDIKQRIWSKHKVSLLHVTQSTTGAHTATNAVTADGAPAVTKAACTRPPYIRLQLLLQTQPESVLMSPPNTHPCHSKSPDSTSYSTYPVPDKATLVLSDDLTFSECMNTTTFNSSSSLCLIDALCVTVVSAGDHEGSCGGSTGEKKFDRDKDMLLALWEWVPACCRGVSGGGGGGGGDYDDANTSTTAGFTSGAGAGVFTTTSGTTTPTSVCPHLRKVREVVVPQSVSFGDIKRLLEIGTGPHSTDSNKTEGGQEQQKKIYFAKPFLWQLRTNPEENIPLQKWTNQPASDKCLLMGAPYRLQTNNRSPRTPPPFLLFKRCFPHQLEEEGVLKVSSGSNVGSSEGGEVTRGGGGERHRRRGREEGGGFQLFTPEQQVVKQQQEEEARRERERVLQALTGGEGAGEVAKEA